MLDIMKTRQSIYHSQKEKIGSYQESFSSEWYDFVNVDGCWDVCVIWGLELKDQRLKQPLLSISMWHVYLYLLQIFACFYRLFSLFFWKKILKFQKILFWPANSLQNMYLLVGIRNSPNWRKNDSIYITCMLTFIM